MFVLQLGMSDASIACPSSFLLSFRLLITLHVLLSMFNILMSGIPSSERLCPGATKNLYFAFCLHVFILLYTCLIVQYPTDYMFYTTELFFVGAMEIMLIFEMEF